MNRTEKEQAVATLAQDLKRAKVAILADYRGLTAGQLDHLRKTVREANGHCRVNKNRLAKLAIRETTYAPLAPMLQGPLALMIGFDDPVPVAKVVMKLAGELPKLELRGGVLDGAVLETSDIKALAELPPKEVVLAQLLAVIQAPATQLVRLLNEPGARVARLVNAVAERAGGAA
jgi:large subunit ribosomal protein L10